MQRGRERGPLSLVVLDHGGFAQQPVQTQQELAKLLLAEFTAQPTRVAATGLGTETPVFSACGRNIAGCDLLRLPLGAFPTSLGNRTG
jgi:hypothetical protein